MSLPDWEHVVRVLTLQDHNTRVVVVGTMMLGLAAGVLGTYMLLRRRALIGDAVSHATLPGIAIAFMVMVAAGASGKWLPGLLLGATATGLLGGPPVRSRVARLPVSIRLSPHTLSVRFEPNPRSR